MSTDNALICILCNRR